MANAKDFTNFFQDTPIAIDSEAVTTAFKDLATLGESFSAITLKAAGKSNDITAKSAKSTLAGLRSVAKVQADPADYAKVFNDFATAQAELVKSHFEALGDVAKLAQSDATELFTAAGKKAAEQGTKAANDAGTKAKAAVKKVTTAAKAA